MKKYTVVVGNIGTVYNGHSHAEALSSFLEYVTMSRNGYGRAAGEDVTLFAGDRIDRAHIGTMAAVLA